MRALEKDFRDEEKFTNKNPFYALRREAQFFAPLGWAFYMVSLMKSALAPIVKGFCYGLGFSAAVILSAWGYEKYAPKKEEYLETVDLKPEELENLVIEIQDTYMVEGRIILRGSIENRNEWDSFWINTKTSVFLGDKLIEVCVSKDRPKISRDKVGEFTTFCESKWEELNLDELRIKTEVTSASSYEKI